MTIYYVAKDGDDSNDGLSWATAKKTLAASSVVAVAISDVVCVSSGVYEENNLWAGLNYVPNVVGVGRVVLDGSGSDSIFRPNLGGSALYLGLNNLTFRNATYAQRGKQSFQQPKFVGCTFMACPPMLNAANYSRIESCAFVSCAAMNTYYNSFSSVSFSQCSFYDTRLVESSPATVSLVNCIFHNATLTGDYHAAPKAGGSHEYNAYHVVDADHSIAGYTSLAAYQAAGYGAGSLVSADPFIDPDNGILNLTGNSSLLFRGAYGARIGALPAAHVLSPNSNAANWNAPEDSTGLEQDASDYWLLTNPGTGTYRSVVIDLGASKNIRRIMPIVDMGVNGEVLDYSLADAAPTQLTMRWRASATPFVDSDVTPAWTESIIDYDLLAATYRYIQVELTPRTNGVV